MQLFTALTRTLLTLSFIPPSIPKIMGIPFTQLPTSNPVGHYFDALLKTGFYYNFIGWAQLTAVILLIIPRTSHIGALMFFPIIINIAVLTTSVGFKGTWLVTIMMAIACLYLVCWDYPRWKSILFSPNVSSAGFPVRWLFFIPPVLGVAGLGIFLTLTGLVGATTLFAFKPATLAFAFSVVFGIVAAVHLRFMILKDEIADNVE